MKFQSVAYNKNQKKNPENVNINLLALILFITQKAISYSIPFFYFFY